MVKVVKKEQDLRDGKSGYIILEREHDLQEQDLQDLNIGHTISKSEQDLQDGKSGYVILEREQDLQEQDLQDLYIGHTKSEQDL